MDISGGVSHRTEPVKNGCAPAGAPEPPSMPSTHLSLHYHIIFSTKDRVPLIAASWRENLHAYLGGVVRNLDGVAEVVGGVNDHVHLLLGLRATHCLADVVRDAKAVSSRWVHDELGSPDFAWQEGYGAFTVSASQRDTVRNYIVRQEEHHRRRTFQEEYAELLERSGVKYNPKYLWQQGFRRSCQSGPFIKTVPVADATG
jgi:putative transposase